MIDKREEMIKTLPFEINGFIVRELNRKDIDIYANWPDYPYPYEMFNTSLKKKPINERDKKWNDYLNNNTSVSLVVDSKEETVVGKFSLFSIDWEEMSVNNVGIRLHPDWCNKGNGAKILRGISKWCFNNGIARIKFDVLSTNKRAIKSYKNAGYKIVDKFYQGKDMFYWMELTND